MTSYWLDEPREPWRGVRAEGRVDVAVVGGGVTGCSCALAAARGGLRVRVYEAREIGSGATGRSGGFALRGGAMPYDVARAELGAERAAELWQLSERALDQVADLAGDTLRRAGSLRLEPERAPLEAEHDALRADGFDVEWVELEGPLRDLFAGALNHPRDGALRPGRWIRALAALAEDAGAELREHTRVTRLDELDAEHVVIATDGYTQGLLPELDRAIRPVRGQVLATAPLARRLFDRPHYARDGFDYWQQTEDRRLILGGRRDTDLDAEYTAEEAVTTAITGELDALAEQLTGERPVVTHRWAGIFGQTEDRLPLVGRVPRHESVWVAAGYSGHGNVLGFACGELVARAILGRPAPELALFDPARLL